MLVLSRKAGEEIVIGSDIRVVVNRISGNRVILGVAAPRDVRIIRGELEPYSREFSDEKQLPSTLPMSGLNMDDDSEFADPPHAPR